MLPPVLFLYIVRQQSRRAIDCIKNRVLMYTERNVSHS